MGVRTRTGTRNFVSTKCVSQSEVMQRGPKALTECGERDTKDPRRNSSSTVTPGHLAVHLVVFLSVFVFEICTAPRARSRLSSSTSTFRAMANSGEDEAS